MNYIEILEEVRKLDKSDTQSMILQLLLDKKVDYSEISAIYVKYLEILKQKNIRKESMFAQCLANAIRPCTEKEWLHSQTFVLVEKWLPDEWINKYLNKRNDEMIEKNRRLLNE